MFLSHFNSVGLEWEMMKNVMSTELWYTSDLDICWICWWVLSLKLELQILLKICWVSVWAWRGVNKLPCASMMMKGSGLGFRVYKPWMKGWVSCSRGSAILCPFVFVGLLWLEMKKDNNLMSFLSLKLELRIILNVCSCGLQHVVDWGVKQGGGHLWGLSQVGFGDGLPQSLYS